MRHIDDDFKPVYKKIAEADGIIIGSPVYVGSATAQVKALIDRSNSLAPRDKRPFEKKVGGTIAVARRAGQNFTFA